jgi:hypothetical protein
MIGLFGNVNLQDISGLDTNSTPHCWCSFLQRENGRLDFAAADTKLGEGDWGERELLHPLIDSTKFGEMVQVIEMQNCDQTCGWCRHSLNNQF